MNDLICCATILASATVMCGQVSVLTWHNDNARTGQNLQETILTTSNVKSSTFGRLSTISVDGKVDAQPLYVPAVSIPNQGIHNVLYVATEHGSLYAFDADTFAQLLKVSLLGVNEVPSDDHGCSQVTPEIGITATPAIDLQQGPHGRMYLIAMSKDTNQHYHQRLHALDLETLTEQLGGPMEIQATSSGTGVENTFNPGVHKERPGLLISNGVVYTSWGSHCDAGSYAGWVLSYSETTLAQVGVLNLIPNGNDGGIWAAGSGPAADSNGNVFLLTGNGTFDTTLNPSGFPSKGDYGNAFVKISTSGGLSVADYFTMLNTVSESAGDVDLGSAGLVLLPPLDNGQGAMVSLVVGAGKDKNIYVLNQANMGGFNPTSDLIYQQLSNTLPGGTWSSPAWFHGSLYYGGVGDHLKAFAFTAGSFSLASQSSNTFAFPGTTPSISANGTSNGIVWAVDNQGTAVLHAYDASNVATELYNSNQATGGRDHFGSGNKFIVPTIANGKVYAGTTNGVGVFGLLSASPAIKITKSHTDNFTQGQQGATYTLTVSNAAGAAPTTGSVTVTDTIPTGLSLVGMAGTGWNCPANNNTCSRSDTLSANSSYPTITVTVNVAGNAPASATNTATVQGGGDASPNNKTANDLTTINPQMFLLTTSITPSGGGTVTPATGTSFANGTVVSLQATPSAGYSFVSWTGNVANVNNPSTTITMTSAAAVTANFVAATQGVPTKVGIWRPSLFNMVAQDVSGNIAFDPGVDRAAFFGATSDIVIFGDWDGSGTTKMGIFRPSVGMFALDMNGNGAWDAGVDRVGFFGQNGDVPVVGDWTGDGKSKIGIYRPSTSLFALDINNNLAWDPGIDQAGKFGQPGDVPVIGKWTDGKSKVGIFRNGFWALDTNGNLALDAGDGTGTIGQAGDTPLLGDWNGDGRTKVGIYRSSSASFGLDYNGNLVWDNGIDRGGGLGPAGSVPVVGDWTGTGISRVGIFYGNGYWALDTNGNIAWDSGIQWGAFGATSDTPVVGKWQQ